MKGISLTTLINESSMNLTRTHKILAKDKQVKLIFAALYIILEFLKY